MSSPYTGSSVVLFGAGASAFGPGISPSNPCLGKDLSCELARCFPHLWGAMAPEVASKFIPDFEAGMRFVWDKYPDAAQLSIQGVPTPYELMQTMTLYFLQFEPDGSDSDLYLRFFRALSQQRKLDRVQFATLNYENLLEFALATMQRPPRALRPHRAVNWWADGVVLRVGNGRALGAGFHVVGRRIISIDHNLIRARMEKEGKYSVMAIYMPGKLTQMGQRRLTAHQVRFAYAIRRVERVAVVGVRPYPMDEHVWKHLADTPATLLYVGERGPFDAWTLQYRPTRPSVWIGQTFEGAIDELATSL